MKRKSLLPPDTRKKIRQETARKNSKKRVEKFQTDKEFRNTLLANRNKENRRDIIVDFRMKFDPYITQTMLAAMLNVSEETIQNWERGRYTPSKKSREALDVLAREKGIEPILWEKL